VTASAAVDCQILSEARTAFEDERVVYREAAV